jgi:hypothetical protein
LRRFERLETAMFDRRIAVASSMIYGVALAALLIVGAITAFIVVAVIGGPVTGIMYWLSAQRARPRS